jgi:hypothetical protein
MVLQILGPEAPGGVPPYAEESRREKVAEMRCQRRSQHASDVRSP